MCVRISYVCATCNFFLTDCAARIPTRCCALKKNNMWIPRMRTGQPTNCEMRALITWSCNSNPWHAFSTIPARPDILAGHKANLLLQHLREVAIGGYSITYVSVHVCDAVHPSHSLVQLSPSYSCLAGGLISNPSLAHGVCLFICCASLARAICDGS